VIDENLVYEVRRELGRKLWEESGVESDVVMPVPDSGRAFASGYADAAGETTADGSPRPEGEDGIAFAEGLMKNRYVGRTFIMPTQDERERAVRLKLNPIRSTVEGKSVTIIDDSIVRGPPRPNSSNWSARLAPRRSTSGSARRRSSRPATSASTWRLARS